MTISGFNPNTALPTAGLMSPLAMGAPTTTLGASLPGSPLIGAQAGVIERPGIASRLVSAMKAAVSELRGAGASDAQIRQQMLAMQAQAPVTLAKSPVAARAVGGKTPKGKSFTDGAGNVREVGTGRILKPTTRPSGAAAPTGGVPTGGMQLPANATTLPGATVYSYDQNGNPVAAPTMQQLGMTPTMLQGLTGAADAQDAPQGPQLNATNQTNIGGLGTGLGMGSAVPVLGQPILTTPAATSPGDTGVAPHERTGGSQVVRNENSTDVANRNQGIAPWGGYGGYDPSGGFATPFAPYGSSMTGAYTLGQGSQGGFLSRLFGR